MLNKYVHAHTNESRLFKNESHLFGNAYHSGNIAVTAPKIPRYYYNIESNFMIQPQNGHLKSFWELQNKNFKTVLQKEQLQTV